MFNEISGRGFRYSDSKAERQFKARLKDGYTREDFANAIENLYKDQFHKDSGFKNATPEFITRPDKLEKFLLAGTKPSKSKKDPVTLDNFEQRMRNN